jgi:flagellar hook protein FlgE
MTFRIALSGLSAAQADLNTTANNIANSNTTGFKVSRAEFGDVYQNSAYGLSSANSGGGVRLERVAQNFSQGTVNITNNSLDLALNGSGFFTLKDGSGVSYARAGNFTTDRDGYVVTGSGAKLQVFPPIAGTSNFNTGTLTDLQLSTGDNPPSATTKLNASLNLPTTDTVPTTAVFSPSDPTSYNETTSATVYDSLGTAHTASLYYVKSATANTWDLYTSIDGNALPGSTALTYSTSGALLTPASGIVALPAYTTTTGSAPVTVTLDLSKTTQYGDQFSVSALTQDGYTTGRLTGINVSANGVVQARYTNGQSTSLGQLAITNFASPQSLQQLGNTTWGETYTSGQALHGVAGSSNFGQIQSGALEASNVDITEQLVNMITAQRNFQANSQMIKTSDEITQTVINIR